MRQVQSASAMVFALVAGALAGCADPAPGEPPQAGEAGTWTVSATAGQLPFHVTLENLDFADFASLTVHHAMDWDDGTVERGDGLPRFLEHTYTDSGTKAVQLLVKDFHGNVLARRATTLTALPSEAVQTLQADLAAAGTPLECGNLFRPELLNVTYVEVPIDPRTYGAKFVAHFEGDTPNVDYALVFYVNGREQMSNTAEGRLVGHVPFDATSLRIFACGGPVGFTADYEASYVGA